MTERLNPEEVALLIRARKLLKQKGLPNGVDVKTICEIAGISRKTGYQWANGLKLGEDPPDAHSQEMSRLKSEHEQLKARCRDLEIEKQGFDRMRSVVEVELIQGDRFTQPAPVYRGGPERPFTQAELREKFQECAESILDRESIQKAIELIESLEQLQDLTKLIEILSQDRPRREEDP